MKGEKIMFDLSEDELKQMEEVDVRTVDIDTLTDIRDIDIDTSMSVEKKLESYAKQTNNLYVHRIGDYVVKVRFQNNGKSIDDKMKEYLEYLSDIHI